MKVVRSITFQPDGSAAIEWIDPEADFKSNGVELNHVVYIPSDADYDEGLDLLIQATLALLADVLDDVPRLGPPEGLRQQRETEDDDEKDICPPCRHGNCQACMGCECEHPQLQRALNH